MGGVKTQHRDIVMKLIAEMKTQHRDMVLKLMARVKTGLRDMVMKSLNTSAKHMTRTKWILIILKVLRQITQ